MAFGSNISFALGLAVLVTVSSTPAWAGPPFLTDDPDPTPQGAYEIYLFAAGDHARNGDTGDVGLDFNYGGAENLQLTATVPMSWARPDAGQFEAALGNIELAAKYQLLHQQDGGWNVAFFPRLFLPANSDLGDLHATLLLPIWIGHAGEDWSTFGGGGCALNRGGGSQDYCEAGWAYTHRFGERLMLGGEVFHQTADVKDGDALTTLGFGGMFDVSERLHLLGWLGKPIGGEENDNTAWYSSALFTF